MQIQMVSRNNTQPPNSPQPAFKGVHIIKTKSASTFEVRDIYQVMSQKAIDATMDIDKKQKTGFFSFNFDHNSTKIENAFLDLLEKVKNTQPKEDLLHESFSTEKIRPEKKELRRKPPMKPFRRKN